MNIDIKNIYNEDLRRIRDIFNSEEFEEEYTYNGELGAIYSKEKTEFKLWSPVASTVTLELFKKEGLDNFIKLDSIEMEEENGVFNAFLEEDLNNIYYRYKVKIGNEINVVTDPYSKGVSANGEYSMVVDLECTNPRNWDEDKKPILKSAVDSIIYEMHIRDFSIDNNSGASFKGKYKGVYEIGTTTERGTKTCMDHLKDLGITHVHLLPTFDYKSVDEKNLSNPGYNWGYDPEHYNSLEGSYSTNPFDGDIRIKEFKEMILNLHNEGIRVVMDVVYNHTYESYDSIFNKVVPYYYYREDDNGNFSNGSGCGNETASERSMFRKFMIDSVCYFAKEYHIDGFRFDLMGLHDIDTMRQIREELNKIDASIIMYGEGWTGGDTPLKYEDRALKANTVKYGNMQIAAFSDDMRDAVKGDVFIADKGGFINGGEGFEETIKCGIVASINHPEIDYSKVIYSDNFWANEPYQTVTYASAHDNYTLFDKLYLTAQHESEEELIKMNKLIASIILTSQGISFIHSGEEILRTKTDENGNRVENSFKSPDYVNKIDWTRKEECEDVYNYYKGLIRLRKNHKIFRMDTAKDIVNNLKFVDTNYRNVVHYTLNSNNLDDSFNECVVVFNGNKDNISVNINDGIWKVILDGNEINEDGIREFDGSELEVLGRSAIILVRI
ncbi:type I pullulanase [Clostridium sp.]|uniref:type I pullulanase n=1 Tax=Clostridium sp. TaxID=1506 RepID=UPI002FCC5BA7